MSSTIVGQALLNSRAEGNARNVLVALSDAAGHDGVTWLNVGNGVDDQERTICRLARVSKSTAFRAIAYLRDGLGEIQTVKVRRGRSFVTVYRVLHGAQAVDYGRIPFEVPHRFDEQPPIHGVKLTPSTERVCATPAPERRGAPADVHGVNLAPSIAPVHGVISDDSRCQSDAVHGVKSDAFTVSRSRARERNLRTVREPAAGTVREPDEQTFGDPAAAEAPATDREITQLVLALRGADAGSPARIIPLAFGLPRSTFVAAVETVCSRNASNPCGLLTHLLKITRAERTAALSAQLQASLGTIGRGYVPAPWTIDAVRAEEPERYVRLLAKSLDDDQIRESLRAHAERMDGLLEIAARVRSGAEVAAERDTPEQARARWVDRHAVTDPPADVAAVINAWDDVDPIERQALHERVQQIQNEAAPAAESEAA